MAVSLNTPSTANLRSDYAISDAAMAQRNFEAAAETGEKQGFGEMLAQADKNAQKFGDIKEAYDSGKYDVPTVEELEEAGVIYIDKETGRIYPENPKDLTTKILKGELDLEGIPAELITPEFLTELAKFTENASEKPTDDEDFFKPAEDSVKTDFAKQIQDSGIMAELAQLLKAAGVEETTDTVTLAEEIPEEAAAVEAVEPSVVQTLAQGVVDEPKAEVDQKAEQKSEPFEVRKTDVFDVSETAAEIPVKANENAGNSGEGQTGGENPGLTAREAPEETINLGAEQLDALQKAAANGEISKVERKTVEAPKDSEEAPVKAEEIPEIKESARVESRVKPAGEELEMLKNAKKPSAEQQNVPVNAENPLTADSPIVFGRDGKEVSVRPSEIVNQAMKAVETAVSENKEQTEYSLVLNPEELGRITVKMTKAADGAVSVTIAAENARTQRILEQNSVLMQSNLRDNGIQLESWQTVRESQQETYAQDYNGSSKNPYFTQSEAENEDGESDEKSFADIIAAM